MSGELGPDNPEVEDDLLSQYGLVEGEVGGSESQNTPWGGEAVLGEGSSSSLPSTDQQVQNTPEQDKKRKAEQLEWMECPVCLETPRSGPIYSCRKGHIICKVRQSPPSPLCHLNLFRSASPRCPSAQHAGIGTRTAGPSLRRNC